LLSFTVPFFFFFFLYFLRSTSQTCFDPPGFFCSRFCSPPLWLVPAVYGCSRPPFSQRPIDLFFGLLFYGTTPLVEYFFIDRSPLDLGGPPIDSFVIPREGCELPGQTFSKNFFFSPVSLFEGHCPPKIFTPSEIFFSLIPGFCRAYFFFTAVISGVPRTLPRHGEVPLPSATERLLSPPGFRLCQAPSAVLTARFLQFGTFPCRPSPVPFFGKTCFPFLQCSSRLHFFPKFSPPPLFSFLPFLTKGGSFF